MMIDVQTVYLVTMMTFIFVYNVVIGIPDYWLTALKNTDVFGDIIMVSWWAPCSHNVLNTC